MKWKGIAFGFAAGLAISYISMTRAQQGRINTDEVMERLRQTYEQQMTVDGTWVHTNPIHTERNGKVVEAFQGGINGWQNGRVHNVEVLIDSQTGKIIEHTSHMAMDGQ